MKELKKVELYGPISNVFTATNTGTWRLERPQADSGKCVKCGLCTKFCPVDAITVDKETGLSFMWDYCKGCGICANECRAKAITMVPEGGCQNGTF